MASSSQNFHNISIIIKCSDQSGVNDKQERDWQMLQAHPQGFHFSSQNTKMHKCKTRKCKKANKYKNARIQKILKNTLEYAIEYKKEIYIYS